MKEGVYNGFDGYLYLDIGVYKVDGVGPVVLFGVSIILSGVYIGWRDS